MTQPKVNALLATADVGRILERTPACVRLYAREGKLPVAALTPGGQRLFSLEDVAALKQRLVERVRT
jgi:DNA-binding transcriptional MerR regulator